MKWKTIEFLRTKSSNTISRHQIHFHRRNIQGDLFSESTVVKSEVSVQLLRDQNPVSFVEQWPVQWASLAELLRKSRETDTWREHYNFTSRAEDTTPRFGQWVSLVEYRGWRARTVARYLNTQSNEAWLRKRKKKIGRKRQENRRRVGSTCGKSDGDGEPR